MIKKNGLQKVLLGGRGRQRVLSVLVGSLALLGSTVPAAYGEDRLRVVATVTDLGDIARQVAGDLVDITLITKGPEDAHFSQPKPSFIKALSQADAFLVVGMDLELGYAPVLLKSARNARVVPGSPGYIDASVAVQALGIPDTVVDRSMGDVHAQGNPHYLLDPVNGLRVAGLIRERFAALRPSQADAFRRGYDAFRRRIGVALFGEELAAKYDVEKLARLGEMGKLDAFLEAQGDAASLAGWLGRMHPFAGTKIVEDHRMWPYFARRFGLEIFADMEPIPGVPPTTRHLQSLVEGMRAGAVGIILASPYYDPRHARFLAEATGATVVRLAHQSGGVDGVEGYVAMVDYNVNQIATALAGRR